jgi:hypothetical protein
LLKLALNTINQQTNQSRINKTINHLWFQITEHTN